MGRTCLLGQDEERGLKRVLSLMAVMQNALANLPDHQPMAADDRAERGVVSFLGETPEEFLIRQVSKRSCRHQALDLAQQGGGRRRCHDRSLARSCCYLYLEK